MVAPSQDHWNGYVPRLRHLCTTYPGLHEVVAPLQLGRTNPPERATALLKPAPTFDGSPLDGEHWMFFSDRPLGRAERDAFEMAALGLTSILEYDGDAHFEF